MTKETWNLYEVLNVQKDILKEVKEIFLDSSMVERTAVNRDVVGSSPTRGVFLNIRLRGQAVKTSPFHGGNTGSIPVGVTRKVCRGVAPSPRRGGEGANGRETAGYKKPGKPPPDVAKLAEALVC